MDQHSINSPLEGDEQTATGLALASPKEEEGWGFSTVFAAHFHGTECVDFCPTPNLTMYPSDRTKDLLMVLQSHPYLVENKSLQKHNFLKRLWFAASTFVGGLTGFLSKLILCSHPSGHRLPVSTWDLCVSPVQICTCNFYQG